MNADDLGRFSMADLFRLEVEHRSSSASATPARVC